VKISHPPKRSIWVKPDDARTIQIIDQRFLPHRLVIENLTSLDQTVQAIREMHVRGAPLIGVTAAYGVYLALLEAPKDASFRDYLVKAIGKLRESRPTAANLEWAIRIQLKAIERAQSLEQKIQLAFETANRIAEEDIQICRNIGEHGLSLIKEISLREKGDTVNILTHCNAGWLACVEWGTATAPIYMAFAQGIPVHIWVNETRPKNQGSNLTAWELLQRGIPHTVIADNTSGHLMQHGLADLILVGTDRTALSGDVANKIGTYLMALAAKDNHVPFYVALPSSSIDWNIEDAFRDIPIEERSPEEVKYVRGWSDGAIKKVLTAPEDSPAKNYAFDITPARLVSGLITERGICQANRESILALFPERKPAVLREEGVIKFDCHWLKTEPLAYETIENLNDWRNRLYDFGLIGVYEDGIGFGNISIRLGPSNQFVISGTQTGGIPRLHEQHYTHVIDFSLEKNSISCKGPIQASSESLTHAVLYRLSPEINTVIHVHHRNLWDRILNQVPTTARDIPYGTPEMALEVKRLFENSDLKVKKIFVMAGHEEGVVTFGKDLAEAANILFFYLHRLESPTVDRTR
jgi:methylthioribose-1-phosphate isomerase